MGRRNRDKKKQRGPTFAQQEEELMRRIRFWKHTVLHIDNEITLAQGEALKAQLRVDELLDRKARAPAELSQAQARLDALRKHHAIEKIAPKLERRQRILAKIRELEAELGNNYEL